MYFVLSFVLGVVGVTVGLLSYTGRWRSWAHASGFAHCFGFAVLFGGIMFLLFAVFGLYLQFFPRPQNGEYVLLGMAAPGVIAAFGWLWMPAFMLPRWFREGREQRREAERAVRKAKKSMKAMEKEHFEDD